MNARQIALSARSASEDKKGIEPLILDIRSLTDIADYFFLVHGTSDRHVRTIADAIVEQLSEKKVEPLHVEGRRDAIWILLDYGSVIVHVFHHQARKFYSLERLWGDAKIVRAKATHERKIKRAR